MIKELDSDGLKIKFDKKENFRLIDVREKEEFEGGHIVGATSIPLSSFKENYSKFVTDLNEEIVLTCRSGGRSMAAAQFLEKRGFKNLSNHEGGISEWTQEDYPISENGKVLPSHLRQMPDLS